jgi:hypothetical protein
MTYLNYAPVVHRRKAGPVVVVGATAAIFAAVCIITGAVNQLTAAIMVGAIGIGLAAMRPTVAIVLVFIYVSLMGDIRRYIVVQSGPVSNDPLLLVGPAVAAACILMAFVKRQFILRTPTSKLLLVLMSMMALEVLNPLQGGLTVGLAGGLFFVVPLMWFWVGQAWGSAEFLEKLLFRVFVPLAVLASLLGLMQAYFGYLHYEALWFRITTESASRPDMRPFSFFSSWSEYAFFVDAALVLVLTPLLVNRFRVVTLLAPLFGFALVIQTVRESIAGVVVALCVLWAGQGRSKAAIGSRLILAVVFAAVSLGLGLNMLREADVSKEIEKNITHTADGFLDVENSTAGSHLALMQQGLIYGVTNPIGLGLGGPTIAGLKAGGFSSEIDVSDMAIACGIGGAILYLVLLALIVRSAVIDWRDHRRMTAFYVLGLIASQPGHVLGGGHYAITIIVWFTIGTFDRIQSLDPVQRPVTVTRRPVRRMPFRSSLATGTRP